jgi:hypothetical protein
VVSKSKQRNHSPSAHIHAGFYDPSVTSRHVEGQVQSWWSGVRSVHVALGIRHETCVASYSELSTASLSERCKYHRLIRHRRPATTALQLKTLYSSSKTPSEERANFASPMLACAVPRLEARNQVHLRDLTSWSRFPERNSGRQNAADREAARGSLISFYMA